MLLMWKAWSSSAFSRIEHFTLNFAKILFWELKPYYHSIHFHISRNCTMISILKFGDSTGTLISKIAVFEIQESHTWSYWSLCTHYELTFDVAFGVEASLTHNALKVSKMQPLRSMETPIVPIFVFVPTLKSPLSSRRSVGLLDVKPGFQLQASHQNETQKIFLRRFPLSRFLATTLRVNKNRNEKFLKNL